MTDNDKLVAYQDYNGFLLMEETDNGPKTLAVADNQRMTHAVVGTTPGDLHFIIPCASSRDASFEEIRVRELGCAEVQILSIEDIR